MIGYATLAVIYDPDGCLFFILTVWVTEMKIHNLLSTDFRPKQVSGIHFNLSWFEKKNLPSQSAAAVFARINPILIYHRF